MMDSTPLLQDIQLQSQSGRIMKRLSLSKGIGSQGVFAFLCASNTIAPGKLKNFTTNNRNHMAFSTALRLIENVLTGGHQLAQQYEYANINNAADDGDIDIGMSMEDD